ncbi:hypothetical protein HY407_05110 [Candidatus Gottesmanbacteria bacterium]|nr:hypothetical protein [Candidatus Gottesmanbacteria bacterium]
MLDKNMKYLAVAGTVLILVLLGGGYYFMQQKAPPTPITGLRCDSAYFNFVVGKPEVIVSASGVDSAETTSVSCAFSFEDPEGTASASTAQAQLEDVPGGKGFKCHDKDKVFPKGSTKFSVAVTDNRGESSSCASTVYIP